jgi:MarR family transcriptional regulator, 2-MHQ and catechol-resistance regulon repressor
VATVPTRFPDDLIPEEADVLQRVASMPVDLPSMAAVANVWRAAQAARAYLEREVLRPRGLSWAGFSLLFNLWVWGSMETRGLAQSMGCARPTVTGVARTLWRRGLVERHADFDDRRLARLELTPAGRAEIEGVFPAFNRGEAALTADLDDAEKAVLAGLLRRVIRTAKA